VEKFLIDNNVEVMLAEFGQTGVDLMEACYSAGVPLVVSLRGRADVYREWSTSKANTRMLKWHEIMR
jgi:hypothetical protein